MKLYLLRPISGEKEIGAWKPWYDKAFGFVVRAENEEKARSIADKNAGNENGWGNNKRNPWLDPTQSLCTILEANGEETLIIRDFNAA